MVMMVLREWSTTSTGLGTDGTVGSRRGGTGTPFWGCGEETGMWCHLGGTDIWAVGRAGAWMKAAYPAGRDRGYWTKNGAQALLLKECGVKFPGVCVSQDPEVELDEGVALSTRGWDGTAVAAGAAETVDGGDVPGLGKWGATDISL